MVCYVDVHDGDPEAVMDAISAVSDGQPKPVVASVVRSDGRRRPRTGSGAPNFLFPESCADVLVRAAERREWLSRPLGEARHYPDLDAPAARALIASFLDREPAGGWLSMTEAEALLARTASRSTSPIVALMSSGRWHWQPKSAIGWRSRRTLPLPQARATSMLCYSG